jgi:hypothetical protein
LQLDVSEHVTWLAALSIKPDVEFIGSAARETGRPLRIGGEPRSDPQGMDVRRGGQSIKETEDWLLRRREFIIVGSPTQVMTFIQWVYTNNFILSETLLANLSTFALTHLREANGS